MGRRMAATGAFAGRPSVAHAEALLRGVARRGTRLDEPVDALVVGVPWIGPHVPREQLNPVTAAAVALGLALRLRRDAFPIREDGTLVLVHPFTRSFAPVTQAPYAAMFNAIREIQEPDALEEAERAAAVGRASARRVPRGPGVSPPAAVRRLGGVRAGALPPRPGHRRGLPRRDRRPHARLRPEPRDRKRARDGPRRRRRPRPGRDPGRPALRAAVGRVSPTAARCAAAQAARAAGARARRSCRSARSSLPRRSPSRRR